MKSVFDDVITAVTFDFVRLPGRLRRIDDPNRRRAMIIFTVVSDFARCFVALCVFGFFFR